MSIIAMLDVKWRLVATVSKKCEVRHFYRQEPETPAGAVRSIKFSTWGSRRDLEIRQQSCIFVLIQGSKHKTGVELEQGAQWPYRMTTQIDNIDKCFRFISRV